MLRKTAVVTCFLRNRGDVLLLERSERVGSYPGRWGGVAGHVEEDDPDGSALREIEEETGLARAVRLVSRGESFRVDDDELGRRWVVHPYLFDCESRDVRLDRESVSGEWVPPTEILRRDTVPNLWTSYERVAPTLDAVASDRVHGSSWISIRALEVVRDRAGWLDSRRAEPVEAWRELEELGRALAASQPSMVVLENRVGRVLRSFAEPPAPKAVEEEAHRAIGRAEDADRESARRAAELVSGRRVLTLSRSETVSMALATADPLPSVVVAESRPGGEGVGVAGELRARGLLVTLVPDAGMAEAIESLDVALVLVGADRVLPSGAVVNKIGTRLAALAARDAGIPFYSVAGLDKLSLTESYARSELFERTPAALVTGIITERGVLEPREVRETAEHFLHSPTNSPHERTV